MGVIGSYCQLCGLPVQHDHYVKDTSGSGMLKIYRGSSEGGGHAWAADEDVFRFAPEHAWLREAVALPLDEGAVLRGLVEDGVLVDTATGVDSFIADGVEDAMVFHARCNELSGKPTAAEDAVQGMETSGWALVEPYQGQLFDFQRFRDDGHAELLKDPSASKQSKTRIMGMIEAAKA